MDESKTLRRVLLWAGIAALVALPLVILLRKKKLEQDLAPVDEDSADIYQSELRA